MGTSVPHVDHYLKQGCGRCQYGGTPECKVHTWTEELVYLRGLLQETELVEEIKWSMPCYTLNGQNVIMLAAFREYASLNFFKGALLKDAEHVLERPGENTQAARYLRFTSLSDIKSNTDLIRSYIHEAIELEKAGKKVAFTKSNELEVPEEFQTRLDASPELKQAFETLTPGRQRAYLLYFAAPKQSKTRESRIDKCIDQILDGIGLHDTYRS